MPLGVNLCRREEIGGGWRGRRGWKRAEVGYGVGQAFTGFVRHTIIIIVCLTKPVTGEMLQ